jgi:hypothetical protein
VPRERCETASRVSLMIAQWPGRQWPAATMRKPSYGSGVPAGANASPHLPVEADVRQSRLPRSARPNWRSGRAA